VEKIIERVLRHPFYIGELYMKFNDRSIYCILIFFSGFILLSLANRFNNPFAKLFCYISVLTLISTNPYMVYGNAVIDKTIRVFCGVISLVCIYILGTMKI
jgi:hypothetical protein